MSPSIYLSHLSRDYVVFEKSCIFTSTTPIPPLHVTCRLLDHMSFDQRYISTSTRPENSVGNTKHRKTYKSKTFFDYLKILIFDLYQYASIKNFPGK